MNKKSYVWNATASTLNSGMSAILMLAVVRILGNEDGGVFALAYSVAQLMLTIGYYDMRSYQATDVGRVYRFGEYVFSRVITCIAMVIASVIYVLMRGYSGDKLTIVILLCLFKMTDAVEDVFHGQLQMLDHFDVAAFMQTVRLAICMIVFVGVLVLKKDLQASCMITLIVSFVLAIVPNIIITRRYTVFFEKIDHKKVIRLLIVCFPLCLGSYLSLYIGNAPKYAIDRFMGNVEQSYYNILFMPSYVINLFSGFVLRPSVTTMANIWKKKDYKGFVGSVIRLFTIICCMTAAVMAIAYFAGVEILNAVYSVNVSRYRPVLMILLLGGGFYALGIVMYYVITITRKQKYMLAVYLAVSVMVYVLADRFVMSYGLLGASISYLAATIMRFLGFLLVAIYVYHKRVTDT